MTKINPMMRWILPGACVLMLCASCARTTTQTTLTADTLAKDDGAAIGFWNDLIKEMVVTNDQALGALILFIDPQAKVEKYEQRIAWLAEGKFLDKGFKRPANEAVERGTVASVLVKAIPLKGGVTMHILGAHPRYATRELIYERIMSPSSPQQGLSGIEFVAILSKAVEYQEVANGGQDTTTP